MKIKERLYVATMADDAAQMAEKYGIGLEIDEFCTASNMDRENLTFMNQTILKKMSNSRRYILHAPYHELSPCAVDPMALELAYLRYNQAYELARHYGIDRMVVHSGYVPYVYCNSWFLEKSIEFWKAFMYDKPESFHIMIENVLEDEPYTLAELIANINDNRVKACLDIGHANCSATLDLTDWVKELGPFISHVNLHNNRGTYDNHAPLGRGNIEMDLMLKSLAEHTFAETTYTVENMKCDESLKWMAENGWI